MGMPRIEGSSTSIRIHSVVSAYWSLSLFPGPSARRCCGCIAAIGIAQSILATGALAERIPRRSELLRWRRGTDVHLLPCRLLGTVAAHTGPKFDALALPSALRHQGVGSQGLRVISSGGIESRMGEWPWKTKCDKHIKGAYADIWRVKIRGRTVQFPKQNLAYILMHKRHMAYLGRKTMQVNMYKQAPQASLARAYS